MSLVATVQCAECAAEMKRQQPDRSAWSRSAVAYIHWCHRPRHPAEATHNPAAVRREVKKAWIAWEALSPWSETTP